MALYCLLGACPVFMAGTGREMSSLYIDECPYWASITSGSVPFRSVPERSDFCSMWDVYCSTYSMGTDHAWDEMDKWDRSLHLDIPCELRDGMDKWDIGLHQQYGTTLAVAYNSWQLMDRMNR